MSRPDFNAMTLGELLEFAESMYDQNRELTAKAQNAPKLEEWEVKRIRDLDRRKVFTQGQLAVMFDVNRSTISRIINRTYYRNL